MTKQQALSAIVASLPDAGPDILEAAQRAATVEAQNAVWRRVQCGWSEEEVLGAALAALCAVSDAARGAGDRTP